MTESKNFPLGLVAFAVVVFGALVVYAIGDRNLKTRPLAPVANASLEDQVLPPSGVELPVRWGDLGRQLVDKGVIDKARFEAVYSNRGGLTSEQKNILDGAGNGRIVINKKNAGFWLNMLWALGLANKSGVLDKGEMQDPQYGGAGVFASTGGWSLAQGDPMSHYSKHDLVRLTPEQAALVDKVSRGVYRPCCNNSTHFPDCNHGMAMLGLLELAASQGAGEAQLYRIALAVNSYWFPDTYLTLAQYFKEKGADWANVDPAQALGAEYSSASGYQNIQAKVIKLPESPSGGSCGV